MRLTPIAIFVLLLALPSAACSQDRNVPRASVGSGRMLDVPSTPAAELFASTREVDGWLEVEILFGRNASHPEAVATSRVFKVDCEHERYGNLRIRDYAADGAALIDHDISSDVLVTGGPQWEMLSQICPQSGQPENRQAHFNDIAGFLDLAKTWPEPRQAPPPVITRLQ